jgi:hypothetical protein
LFQEGNGVSAVDEQMMHEAGSQNRHTNVRGAKRDDSGMPTAKQSILDESV